MQRIFIGHMAFSSLLSVNVLAKKEKTVQMAPIKEMACDKARGLADKKAIGLCKKRGGVKDAPEGECKLHRDGQKLGGQCQKRRFLRRWKISALPTLGKRRRAAPWRLASAHLSFWCLGSLARKSAGQNEV